jgi:hypothetical protein
MANYYIFLSNEADILREMGVFIQALKVSCEIITGLRSSGSTGLINEVIADIDLGQGTLAISARTRDSKKSHECKKVRLFFLADENI